MFDQESRDNLFDGLSIFCGQVLDLFRISHQLFIINTVDPIGFASSSLASPQSLNLFAYVGNNPIDFTDPSGLNKDIPEEPGIIIIESEKPGLDYSFFWWRLFGFGGGSVGIQETGGGGGGGGNRGSNSSITDKDIKDTTTD